MAYVFSVLLFVGFWITTINNAFIGFGIIMLLGSISFYLIGLLNYWIVAKVRKTEVEQNEIE
jgi:hypothetical protein